MGSHRQFAKGMFYEESAKIPFIIVPTAEYKQFGSYMVDDRLVELRDMMPTLLDMAGIPIPETVEGASLVSDARRDYLYGEHYVDDRANRMIRSERYKMIYYPVGNCFQLFDMQEDPNELHNLAGDPAYADVLAEHAEQLVQNLYGSDTEWLEDGKLVGWPDKPFETAPNRGLNGQRGWRFL